MIETARCLENQRLKTCQTARLFGWHGFSENLRNLRSLQGKSDFPHRCQAILHCVAIPADPDPRKVVGGATHTLSTRVTNDAECHSRYGASAKNKTVPGRVLNVVTDIVKGRSKVTVFSELDLGGGIMKSIGLHIMSVRKGHPAPPISEASAPPPTPLTSAVGHDT